MKALLLLAILAAPIHAQLIPSDPHSWTDQWVFGLTALGGIPTGEFRENEDGGGGGEISIGFQPFRREPLVLRAGFAAMQYAAQYSRGMQRVCDDYSCWTEFVRYQSRNHSLMVLQAGPEILATDGTWRPFAFALAGVTMFRSTARLPASDPNGTESRENLFSSSNASTSYGAGVRRVATFIGREAGFELSGRFTRNASARYVNEDGVTQNPDGSWTVTPREGAANLWGIHLGFWLGPRIRSDER